MKKLSPVFTLIELLVVIAIIAILSCLLLPALGKARDTGKKIACVNRFKQVGAGIHMYVGDYNDYLAPAGVESYQWAWPLRSYVGMKDNDFSLFLPNSAISHNVFHCPSSNFYQTPTPVSWFPSGFCYLSYGPTLCSVNYPPTVWGGYVYSYLDKDGAIRLGGLIPKPFRKVPINSVLSIEARKNSEGRCGVGSYLKPEYASWAYSPTSAYCPDFCHGKTFNALFADAHVENIRFGTAFDENWIKK